MLIVSCAEKPVSTSSTQTIKSDQLAQGKTVYENSCAKCHELPNPKSYSSEKWIAIMKWMAPKAKLTQEQSTMVYNYVTQVK